MAKQPTSMIGHIFAATRQAMGAVFMNPASRFVGRTLVEMGQRLIPQGASELGQVLYGGSAYAPPGVTERLGQPLVQSNVHGTGQAQQADTAQMVQTSTVEQAKQQPTQSATQKTHGGPEKDFQARIKKAAARMRSKDNRKGKKR
jgi:hypothetical protein